MGRVGRRPREKATHFTLPYLLYYELWVYEQNGMTPREGTTREIRMDERTCNLAARDLFGEAPNDAELGATHEAFYWMPVKQAWNLVGWALDKMEEPHERFAWLRERAEKQKG